MSLISALPNGLRLVLFSKSQLALFEEIRPVKGSVDKHGKVRAPHFARRMVSAKKPGKTESIQLDLFSSQARQAPKPGKKTLADVAREFGQFSLFGDAGEVTEAAKVEAPAPKANPLRDRTLEALRAFVADKGGKEQLGATLIRLPDDKRETLIARFADNGLTADEVRDELGLTWAADNQAEIDAQAKAADDALDDERAKLESDGRAQIKEAIAAKRAADQARGYSSVVLETKPVSGGRVYSGKHSGMGEEDEIGFESGAVKAGDIAKVHFIRNGEVVRTEAFGVAEEGPHEGERNADGLVFRDGRWHRDDEGQAPAAGVSGYATPAKLDLPTVELDGDTWYVLNTGHRREDGKVLAHLASATRGNHAKNGVHPLQMETYVDMPMPGAKSGLEMPEFAEGKTTVGVKEYYEKVAGQIISLADTGDVAGLEAMKAKGMTPNAKGKVSNTWAGKTANSKLVLALHAKALAAAGQVQSGPVLSTKPAADAAPGGDVANLESTKPAKVIDTKSPISDSDPDALERLQAKLEKLQKVQDQMKRANKMIRAGDDDGLRAAGFSDAQIAQLKTKDFAGRIGFPDYAIKNNGAQINLLKKRIAGLVENAPKQPAAPVALAEAEPVAAAVLPGLDYSGEFDSSAMPEFGVRPGVSKQSRRDINQRVADLVRSGRDDFSEEEKALLRQYSGWGGCGQSLNEFYTPVTVAGAIWKAMTRMGLKPGAKVLEPSCGAGVFLHTAPAGVVVTGVEMDATSSQVAAALHGGRHEVVNSGFERFATTDDRQFDAVIGNPPFGPRGEMVAWDKQDISRAEQYFVDASLDKCAGGGIVALVLPTGIMDNQNARWLRERILRKGEFLGAIRMPNTAFEASHTEVTTDVLFVRKRDNDAAQALMTVDKSVLKTLGLWDEDFLAGSYFTDGRGKENICGVLEDGWRAKAGIGNDITVNGGMSGVPEAIAGFEPEVGKPVSFSDVLDKLDADGKAKATNAAKVRPYQARLGDVKEVDGVAYVLQGNPPRWHRIDEVVDSAKVGRAAELAKLIDTLAKWREGGADGDIQSTTFKELPDAIRAFMAEHGNPNKDADLLLAAKADRTLYRLLGAVKPDGSLSDLVQGKVAERIVGSFETAAESLAAEGGEFTAADVADRWRKGDESEVVEHLHASDAYCLNPETGRWTTADNYLAGELWPKLDSVRAALAGELSDLDRAKLEGQAIALEKKIDPRILNDVEIRLNDAWIPLNVVEAWFKAKQDAEGVDNQYVRDLKPVEITFEKGLYRVTGGNSYQMEKFEKYLNRSGLRRDDKPMIDGWNEEFKSWLCGSEYRESCEELYNRKFRGFVEKTFSNAPFEIPGMVTDGLKDYQYGGLRWALNAGKGIVAADVGLGKAQPLDAKILTPTGWVRMGDIRVGDKVIAGDGSATTVTGVFPQGEKEIFRVGFSDGSATECCDEHLWLTQTTLDRNNARRNCADKGVPKVRQLSEIRETLRYLDREKNHSIPMVGAVQFESKETPVDGYLLGALIGDGGLSSGTPRFTNEDAGVIAEFMKVVPDGVVAVDTNASGAYTVRLSRESDSRRSDGAPSPNPLKEVLRDLGLLVKSADKFIPDLYKFNSVAVRVATLQGLMDTDGYVDKQGVTVQFCSVSERLAKDVQFLVQSLGGNATIKSRVTSFTHNGEKRNGQRSYLVHLRLPAWVEPFRGSVRKERVRPKTKYSPVRYITSAESIGVKPAQCIAVDHPSHLYVTDDFIVTHNTARGLMLARMMKVSGQSKRPVIVVPKSVLANWVAEANKWFPGASVAVIGETYVKNEDGSLKGKVDNAAERNRKLHDLLQNEYDFILISRDAFNDIDLSPTEKGDMVDRDFWTQRGDSLGNKGDKQLNDIRTRHKQAAAGMDFRKRSDALWFDELGIDGLIVDEAHAYKNLWAAKARFGDSPKYLGGSAQSKRARDMFYKTQWLRARTDGKNVYGLTATPTKNSPLEIYSMLSHVAPEAFEQIGIRNSEEFLDRFCQFATEYYIDPTSQKYVSGEVVSGFKNLDELRGIMDRYIDRTTADMVGLKLPAKDERNVLVSMSASQQAEYDRLRQMAEEASKQDAADGEAHIFSIMDKMAKAATDLELLDPVKYKGAKSPKLEEAADNILKGVADGGQVVFSDYLATHQKIADLLVKRGIPRDQIAIINAKEAEDSADRQNIADAFNAGKVKVVIGNTATMGEGINLQHGTTDIHHIDLPWEPASVQQRNGRGVRQGNKSESVRIHTYMVKGTFDGVRWDAVAAKKDWQDLLWNGGDTVENLAKQKFSNDEMRILLSADPDEARQQYQSDKESAAARFRAEKRAEAIGQFKKFRDVQASFSALKDKNTKTANSLRMRLDSWKNALRLNPFFKDKELLNSDAAAVISPASGEAFYAGKSFELGEGAGAKAGRYVVVGADGDSVIVRKYGEPAGKYGTRMNVEHLADVVPGVHSESEEAAYVQRKMEEAVKAGQSAIRNPKEAAHLPEETTRKLYDQLQAQMKEAFVSYKDGWASGANVPLVHPETGEAKAIRSYDARKHLEDGYHLMLPSLPEHREKAMNAWVEQERTKSWGQSSSQKRRGGRTEWHNSVHYAGRKYDSDKSNPWGAAAKELFGDDFLKEARAKFEESQLERVKAAPNTVEAVKALAPLLVPVNHQYGSVSPAWGKQHIAVLYAKAKANGDLGRPVSEVATASPYGADGEVPAWVLAVNAGNSLGSALYERAKAYPDLAAVMALDRDMDPLGKMAALEALHTKKQTDPRHWSNGYTREHHPDVLAAMRHLVDKHPDIGDKLVREVLPLPSGGLTDPVFGGEAQGMTMREALNREVKNGN